MSAFQRLVRIVAGILLGGVVGYLVAICMEFAVGPFLASNAVTWLAIIVAIHGGAVGAYGWNYWIALNNDAADVFENQTLVNDTDDKVDQRH